MNAFREIGFFAVTGVIVVFAIALLEHFGKVAAGNSQIIIVIGSNMVTAAVTRWTDRRPASPPTSQPPAVPGKETDGR
jgi:hypothetical protein